MSISSAVIMPNMLLDDANLFYLPYITSDILVAMYFFPRSFRIVNTILVLLILSFCCDYAKLGLRFMHLHTCATLPFPELRLTEMVCFNVFYVCIFIPFCSDSFIWF